MANKERRKTERERERIDKKKDDSQLMLKGGMDK